MLRNSGSGAAFEAFQFEFGRNLTRKTDLFGPEALWRNIGWLGRPEGPCKQYGFNLFDPGPSGNAGLDRKAGANKPESGPRLLGPGAQDVAIIDRADILLCFSK